MSAVKRSPIKEYLYKLEEYMSEASTREDAYLRLARELGGFSRLH